MTFAEDLNDTNLTYELDDNEIIPESYSFSDFQEKINQSEDNSSISINGTYRYDKNIDENNSLNDGVVISKNLTIIGDNCTIDGNNLARCFHIKSNFSCFIGRSQFSTSTACPPSIPYIPGFFTKIVYALVARCKSTACENALVATSNP